MGIIGTLLIWPIEAAVSWATWYAFTSVREKLYVVIHQKFRKMLTRSYDMELLLSDWLIVNSDITRKLQQDKLKKLD